MIIAIGDIEVPTVGGKGTGDNPHGPNRISPNDQGCRLLIITPPIKTLPGRGFTACIMLKPFIMHP